MLFGLETEASRIDYCKWLKLSLAEDNPIFTSSNLCTGLTRCEECRDSYQPLTYSINETIYAKHYHPLTGKGGIYLYGKVSQKDGWMFGCNGNLIVNLGWLAVVDTPGNVSSVQDEPYFIADKVKIKEIKAICIESTKHKLQEIDKGFVCNDGKSLVPICSLEVHPEYLDKVMFRFFKTEGKISFSKI